MLTEQQILELASAMESPLGPGLSLDAGYTYFGQFVSHELLEETRGHPVGTTTPRFVTSRMELDSLYGPLTLPPSTPTFQIKKVGSHYDLERNGLTGVAMIPERRNDENIIVSQLHLFWQRFHNWVEKDFAINRDHARRMVTLVFQLLVVEDFLRQLLEPKVFESYFRRNERWLSFKPTEIQPVFSHACFRFGHSMVRTRYRGFPNEPGQSHLVKEFFQRDIRLTAEHVVDWRHFFGWPNGAREAQKAFPIDPSVVHFLKDVKGVPIFSLIHYARLSRPPLNLIVINIRSGEEAKLPPGLVYARSLLSSSVGAKLVERFGFYPQQSLWRPFAESLRVKAPSIDINNLPMWPYLLNEAAVTQSGKRLGTLGSLICAETIANSIATAEHSILNFEPYSIETVLNDLGELGDRIRDMQRRARHLCHDGRTLCMRHILELVPA